MRSHRNLSVILVTVLLLGGCASAPLDYPREPSAALVDTDGGSEAAKVSEWLDGKENTNGFYPLTKGFDAFGQGWCLPASYFKPLIGVCASGCCWTTSLPPSMTLILPR